MPGELFMTHIFVDAHIAWDAGESKTKLYKYILRAGDIHRWCVLVIQNSKITEE